MNALIRKVKQEDNFALAKIIRNVFEEHGAPTVGTVYSDPTTDQLFECFQIPRAALWIAEINNKLVGCCGVYPTRGLPANTAELVKLYLVPQSRGLGIGKELVNRCLTDAGNLGYKKLYLESLPQFEKAVRIYEKLGFRKLQQPLGNSGHISCNIWMIKEL